MRYALFDLDVTEPLAALSLSPGDAGYGVLLRRKGIPIGFWMEETHAAHRVPADDLARAIGVKAGAKIIAEAVRDELLPPPRLAALPFLTVAICTKDRPEKVKRLLLSLAAQAGTLPEGSGGLEILIVDNAPSDERTRELSGQWTDVRYVREPRPGLDFARNRALREARGDILAFLDDDVVVDRHWAAGLSSAWADNPDAAAFTGQVLPLELETEAQIRFEQRGGFRRGFDRVRYGPVLPGNSLYPGGAGIFGAGANMAFRTDVLRRLGGFDDALDAVGVPGGGDLDVFYRVIRAGYGLVYEPRFLVFHEHRRELKALRAQYRRSWGFGFMCYVSKSLSTDPGRKGNLLRLIVWWYTDLASMLARHLSHKLRGNAHIPPSMILGEIYGGVIGLFGGYSRSVKRVERIRKRFP